MARLDFLKELLAKQAAENPQSVGAIPLGGMPRGGNDLPIVGGEWDRQPIIGQPHVGGKILPQMIFPQTAESDRPADDTINLANVTDDSQPSQTAANVLPEVAFSPSQITQGKINENRNKDYSIKKDANGNVIERGKDRDNDYDWKDVLGGLGLGILKGLGSGGGIVGGAIEGVRGAFDRNYVEKNRNERETATLISQQQQQQQQEGFNSQMQSADLQRENIIADNERQNQQGKDLTEYRNQTIEERRAQRETSAKNVKMRTVAQMLSTLPVYDPTDPRFAEITKALGDVGLPVTPKDAKKQIKLVQDAETGAWTTVLTDTAGSQEVRPITNKDGSQLVTTSNAKVMANAAGGRQESQQNFTLRRQQLQHQMQMEVEKFRAAEKGKSQSEMIAARERLAKLKADYDSGETPE